MTRDEVLFGFHRFVRNPSPADVAWWVKAFPEHAEEIRAHAVEIIDMEAMAAAREDEIFRLATDG